MAENTYQFDLPTHQKSIIKVIGVGGGGSNAVNHMFNLGIKDVEFVVCNTDNQALESSPVPNKLQLGMNLTGGLGAGANPERGRNAAIESKEEIRELLSEDTKMVFITAGMGGGTGTGAAPIIAQVARELDILTVGIVTAPFAFEGKKKNAAANEGIAALREVCDTVLVILNDKLREIFGNLPIREAFGQADNVLTTAAKGIAEIITVPGYVNVDFEDVKTVMKGAGAAVMGSAQTHGENRAIRAAEEALNSPLLNNRNIHGAEKILLSIISGEEAELQMDELAEITDYMTEFSGEDAEVIFGHGVDPELGENIRVTVIATGFDRVGGEIEFSSTAKEPANSKRVYDLESTRQIKLFVDEDEEEEEMYEEEEERSFTFDSLKETIEREVEEEDEEFEYEFEMPEQREEENEEEVEEYMKSEVHKVMNDGSMNRRRIELMEQRMKREEALNGSSKKDISSTDYKEKFDVPAFERKKVTFQKVPHSSERNISRFNLTDDNQLLGNNRYLHDNVD
ncbi:MAG: cell division protein FtsZ [Bacteroidota bacterium]